jgi:acyl dehydratase
MLDMALLARLVVDWAGDHRRLRSLRCRFSGVVVPGDTLTCAGVVTRVDGGVAELEVWADNQDGKRVLGKGAARVSLE